MLLKTKMPAPPYGAASRTDMSESLAAMFEYQWKGASVERDRRYKSMCHTDSLGASPRAEAGVDPKDRLPVKLSPSKALRK